MQLRASAALLVGIVSAIAAYLWWPGDPAPAASESGFARCSHYTRVLLIADRPRWAFDWNARDLARELERGGHGMPCVHASVRHYHSVTPEDIQRASAIVVYWWHLLSTSAYPQVRDALRERGQRSLYVGVCSHQALGRSGAVQAEFRAVLTAFNVAGVFANSVALHTEAARAVPPHIPVIYAPMGVTSQHFPPAAEQPRAAEADPRPLQLMWAGTLKQRKLRDGIELKGVRSVVAPAVFKGGPALSRLSVAAAHNLTHHWPLTRRTVAEVYAHADTFVCASYTEGTPNPLLEAAAARVALVSTPVGNAPQLLRSGANGVLLPDRATHSDSVVRDALVDAMTLLRWPRARRQALQWRAQAEVALRWQWRHKAAAYALMLRAAVQSTEALPHAHAASGTAAQWLSVTHGAVAAALLRAAGHGRMLGEVANHTFTTCVVALPPLHSPAAAALAASHAAAPAASRAMAVAAAVVSQLAGAAAAEAEAAPHALRLLDACERVALAAPDAATVASLRTLLAAAELQWAQDGRGAPCSAAALQAAASPSAAPLPAELLGDGSAACAALAAAQSPGLQVAALWHDVTMPGADTDALASPHGRTLLLLPPHAHATPSWQWRAVLARWRWHVARRGGLLLPLRMASAAAAASEIAVERSAAGQQRVRALMRARSAHPASRAVAGLRALRSLWRAPDVCGQALAPAAALHCQQCAAAAISWLLPLLYGNVAPRVRTSSGAACVPLRVTAPDAASLQAAVPGVCVARMVAAVQEALAQAGHPLLGGTRAACTGDAEAPDVLLMQLPTMPANRWIITPPGQLPKTGDSSLVSLTAALSVLLEDMRASGASRGIAVLPVTTAIGTAVPLAQESSMVVVVRAGVARALQDAGEHGVHLTSVQAVPLPTLTRRAGEGAKLAPGVMAAVIVLDAVAASPPLPPALPAVDATLTAGVSRALRAARCARRSTLDMGGTGGMLAVSHGLVADRSNAARFGGDSTRLKRIDSAQAHGFVIKVGAARCVRQLRAAASASRGA